MHGLDGIRQTRGRAARQGLPIDAKRDAARKPRLAPFAEELRGERNREREGHVEGRRQLADEGDVKQTARRDPSRRPLPTSFDPRHIESRQQIVDPF